MVRASGIFVNMNIPDIEDLPYLEYTPKSMHYKPPKSVDILDDLPDEQGVYFFVNFDGEVCYVGEAGSLRRRIKSHHEILQEHRKDILSISWIVLPAGHEVERFLLEKAYIMCYKPKWNTEIKNNMV